MAPPAAEATCENAVRRTDVTNSSNKSDNRTYIARLIKKMETSLQQLDVDTDNDDDAMRHIERMSILIHESMSISSRNYHSVQHVFDISQNIHDPVAVLAALFHDCVYYNIDGGLSTVQAAKLKGVLDIQGSVLRIAHPGTDSLLDMTIRLFGYSIHQEVTPMTGLNEFLSAVIAVRELEALLPRKLLAQIASCIEMTIPFRPSIDGKTPAQRLFQRLQDTVTACSLDLSQADCIEAVQRAVILSNHDVGNFGSEDQLWFLDNTWSLLPESNEALRHQYLYTVKEFQFAVFKMNGFFNFLKPDVVFQQFRGVPSDEELHRLTTNCRRNLEVGKKYVGAKLLSISVLAAFAELTGGDAPISLFMGDLPSRHHTSRRLEDTLPLASEKPLKHCDQAVYDILAFGRRSETSFDVRQSPLAAYFYSIMGDCGVEKVLKDIKVHPMDTPTAKALLTTLPRHAVSHVSENMSNVAMSRRELIRKVVRELPPPVSKKGF